MTIRQYAPGETILAEGTFGDQTYLIQEGEVRICKETGREKITLTTLQPGEVFGEMYLLDETGFRSASAIAETAVTVEVMTREEMEAHLAATPPIMMSIMQTLSKRLSHTSQENALLKFRGGRDPWHRLARKLGLRKD